MQLVVVPLQKKVMTGPMQAPMQAKCRPNAGPMQACRQVLDTAKIDLQGAVNPLPKVLIFFRHAKAAGFGKQQRESGKIRVIQIIIA